MKAKRATILHWATVLTACVMIAAPGCGGGFLGLEDFQRDILGGVAAALLLQPAPAAPAGQPVPGADGVNCWDTNGNGQNDPDEDTNGDGAFDALDCAGEPGSPGRDGSNDISGLDCWDLNGNGAADAAEDINGDGAFNTLDCQGQPGAPGANGTSGSSGSSGVDGQEHFHVFVDDFFASAGTPNGSLPIEIVSVDEPVLGVFPTTAGITEIANAVAFRVAIPEIYNTGNDVGMRIAFYRTGPFSGGCFAIELVSKRLRDGFGIENYGPSRWIRIDLSDEVKADAAAEGVGSLVVVDLPLNTATGLDLPGDLASADFLAFELSTHQNDGGAYQLLTVEFDESRPGTTATDGATIFLDNPDGDIPCGFVDCNENGFADSEDIAQERSTDCDGNGVPDECAACPPLDLVFLMDTSGSMQDEGVALCEDISGVLADLADRGITVRAEILAISPNDADDLPPCVNSLDDSVSGRFDTSVPGDNGSCPSDLNAPGDARASEKDENWASATAIVAERFPWTPDAIRVIVPVSDEGACLGNSCDDPGRDRDAVENAIIIARSHDVVVSPIAAGGSSTCVITLAEDIATGTGGTSFLSQNPEADLAGAIDELVTTICRSAGDCNANGIPDDCEIADETSDDCNENGLPDECEIAVGTEASGGPFFCTTNCDPDENGNGIPDSCEPQ